MSVTVMLKDCAAAIKQVVVPGRDLLVHASLGRIGRIDGAVEDLIEMMLAAVTGSGGTLVMMTDTRSFAQTGRFSMSQPSETGLLTERFRLFPDVTRSCVPMVSFCALGPRSAEYTQEYNSHLDETATITRLLENDGDIMLIGVAYEKCTLYHLSEERVGVPYNTYKTFAGHLVEGNQVIRPIAQRYFVRADMETRKSPSVAGRMLEDTGMVRVAPLGQRLIRAFSARQFDDCCMEVLRHDSRAFLEK